MEMSSEKCSEKFVPHSLGRAKKNAYLSTVIRDCLSSSQAMAQKHQSWKQLWFWKTFPNQLDTPRRQGNPVSIHFTFIFQSLIYSGRCSINMMVLAQEQGKKSDSVAMITYHTLQLTVICYFIHISFLVHGTTDALFSIFVHSLNYLRVCFLKWDVVTLFPHHEKSNPLNHHCQFLDPFWNKVGN